MLTQAIPTIAPPALWRIARAFICVLHDLFGAPEDVARADTLSRAAYALMLSWLRAGEAMMRRLIAIEAAVFAPTAPRPQRAKRTRLRQLMHFFPDKPEDWRVSFRSLSSSPACGGRVERGSGETKLGTRKRFYSAWPLAERYEALLRAFNDPIPYARRLARRLSAAPRLIARVLAAPAEYEHRVDRAEDFSAAVRTAWDAPDSS